MISLFASGDGAVAVARSTALPRLPDHPIGRHRDHRYRSAS